MKTGKAGKTFWKIVGEDEYEGFEFRASTPMRAFLLYDLWTRNPKHSVLLLECVNGASAYQKGICSNDPDAWKALRLTKDELKHALGV